VVSGNQSVQPHVQKSSFENARAMFKNQRNNKVTLSSDKDYQKEPVVRNQMYNAYLMKCKRVKIQDRIFSANLSQNTGPTSGL
jgi:hypothetical protein